jgi:hypothetical protein
MLNWCKRVSLAFVAFGSAATGADLDPTPVGKDSGLIDRKVFFGNPDKASVKLSPDGQQISYIAPVNGVMNVFVGPTDKPDAANRSPKTPSAAYANTSGPSTTNTCSICRTKAVTRTSTSFASTSRTARPRI